MYSGVTNKQKNKQTNKQTNKQDKSKPNQPTNNNKSKTNKTGSLLKLPRGVAYPWLAFPQFTALGSCFSSSTAQPQYTSRGWRFVYANVSTPGMNPLGYKQTLFMAFWKQSAPFWVHNRGFIHAIQSAFESKGLEWLQTEKDANYFGIPPFQDTP